MLFTAHSVQCRKTLWTVINGYLPLALEMKDRTMHCYKGSGNLICSKWFCFSEFWGLGSKCLATALNCYSPNLEKIAHCSMITPLTFSQTVTKTTSRGHTLLWGKICILRYCFLWKYIWDLFTLVSWLLSVVFAMLSTAICLAVGWSDTVSTDGRTLVSYQLQVPKPFRITKRNFVLASNYICLISIITQASCVCWCVYRIIFKDL